MSKISDKDKKAWEIFINSKDKVLDKDNHTVKKNIYGNEKIIDLHGYNLHDANIKIENDASSESWRFGTINLDIRPDGRR